MAVKLLMHKLRCIEQHTGYTSNIYYGRQYGTVRKTVIT